MADKVTAFLTLIGPDNRLVNLAPGDEVPEWATIGDHAVEKSAEKPVARKRTEKSDAETVSEK